MEFQFGKFKGRRFDDPLVTTKYLEWLRDSTLETVEGIEAELARRQQVEANNVSMAERIVVAGFRALSKEFKNDPEVMGEITGARAALDGLLEKHFEEQGEVEDTRRMDQASDAKSARNRAYATKLLQDKHAESDDVEWARKILGMR